LPYNSISNLPVGSGQRSSQKTIKFTYMTHYSRCFIEEKDNAETKILLLVQEINATIRVVDMMCGLFGWS